jgi:hypothetical protein
MSDKPKKDDEEPKNYTLKAEPGSFTVTGGDTDLRVDKSATWPRLSFEEKAEALRRGEQPLELWEETRKRWPAMSGAERLAALEALEVPRDLWLELAQGGAPAIEAGFDASDLQQRAVKLFALVRPAQVIRLGGINSEEAFGTLGIRQLRPGEMLPLEEQVAAMSEREKAAFRQALSDQMPEMLDSFEHALRPVTQVPMIITETVIERLSPKHLPQPTFPEMKTAGVALADGRTGRRWQPIVGELALMHSVEGSSLQTRFRARASLNWWGLPATLDSLLKSLSAGGVPATLAFHAIVALVAQRDGRVYTTLDELIRLVGWGDAARRAGKRATLRRDMWLLLLLCSELEVIGARRGQYRDPLTRKIIDTQSEDPLIVVTGKDAAPQMSLDGVSEPPIAVELTAGKWLDRYLGNRRMLTDYGNVLKLAELPGKQPSGAWAQAVGLALHQLWREESSKAEIKRLGGGERQSVQYRPFTRREIFDLYMPSPSPEDILDSDNPQRAIDYWKEAIKKLKQKGIIGYCETKATAPVKPKRGAGAGDWREAWLNEPLDIRPTGPGLKASAEILTAAKKARQARRKPTRKTKSNGS